MANKKFKARHNKAVYSGIMNRWIFGGVLDQDGSSIFKDGYDDPTYMTFKVEFGEWGASVLDRSVVQNGLTEFGLNFTNYDQLPAGLLNCPYPGTPNENIYWQTDARNDSTIHNKTKFYSAFQYLRSRNEDTRAKYLYYFVNGLYEIQHDYPFIFKKITGIGELEKFDPTAGQRLKTPAKITLECYEGLNLKIRTLFEFYRKAAWDDVYQRWILPENMREFKMIIYVFERRIFQNTKMFHATHSKEMAMSYSDLNADIPVKAYECMPCEFSIADSQSWNDSYSSGTENSEETSKLVVQVKNVKTYFKNGLLNKDFYNNDKNVDQKIDSIMIYDLVENIERTGDNSYGEDATLSNLGNATVNGVKALFLNKNILLENEEANKNLKTYVWGHSENGLVASPGLEIAIANRARTQLNKKQKEISDNYNYFNPSKESQQIFIEDNEYYRGGWMHSLASAPSYDPHKSFWSNLGDSIMNVLTGTRRLVLISGATYIHTLPYCLIDSFYIPQHVFSPLSRKWYHSDNGFGHGKPKTPKFKTRKIYDQDYLEIEDERELPEQDYRELDDVREIPEQEYQELINREVPEQEYGEIEPEREVPEQEYSEMEPEREIPDQKFGELNGRSVPKQRFKKLEKERRVPYQFFRQLEKARKLKEQDYREIDKERGLPKQDYREIDKERELIDQTYKELDKERELSKQDYKELAQEREIKVQEYLGIDKEREQAEQKYKNLEKERTLPTQEFKELEEPRNTDVELMELLLIARSLPGFKDLTLEDIRKIPKQDLIDLKEAEERSVPSFKADKSALLESIKEVEGSNMKLLELDKDNKTVEDNSIEMLKQNQALANFGLEEPNTETADEKAEKLKKITTFVKDFTDNSDKIKQAYVSNILEMKNDLRETTIEIINNLPKNNTYIIEGRDAGKEPSYLNDVMISQNDIDQINHNMKFIAINDNDVEKLSFQTLITIQDELSEAVERSHAITGLTKIVNDSVATNPDEKTREHGKQSVIEEPKKDKMKVIY